MGRAVWDALSSSIGNRRRRCIAIAHDFRVCHLADVPGHAGVQHWVRETVSRGGGDRPSGEQAMGDVREVGLERLLPTGTVTFLLTDIARSTQHWEDDRDAMANRPGFAGGSDLTRRLSPCLHPGSTTRRPAIER
jgi:hypothetical protein